MQYRLYFSVVAISLNSFSGVNDRSENDGSGSNEEANYVSDRIMEANEREFFFFHFALLLQISYVKHIMDKFTHTGLKRNFEPHSWLGVVTN